MKLSARRPVILARPKGGAQRAPQLAMLTYFTLTTRLPRLDGSSVGMGLALAEALGAARAVDAPTPGRSVAALAALNCVPASLVPRQPTGGAALLDLLV